MTEPLAWTLAEAAQAVRHGAASCVELVEASLRKAERLQPQLNCFIGIDAERAIERARDLDNHPETRQLPLAGIPVAHKDMYYRAGRVSTCGSRSRLQFRPAQTADVLQQLDAAGTVQIGTLNMAEFAFGATGHNACFGACRNPWNPNHIPGGSSSGSGAAVGAGIVHAAMGSDTGGSIRIPAAACGVVGLKTTQGLVSRRGVMPMAPSLDCFGPLARSAQDIGMLMDCLAPLPAGQSYTDGIGQSPRGMKIGIPTNHYYDALNPAVRTLMERSLKVFEETGCELVEVEIPDHEHLTSLAYIMLGTETASHHRRLLAEHDNDYGVQTRARLLAGFFIPGSAYMQARQLRARFAQRFVEQVFSRCDVLHAPVLREPVPTLKETDRADDVSMVRMITSLSHCTRLTNYLGVPAISAPCGYTEDRMPAGFQLIGRPYDEQRLIGLIDWHEQLTGLRNQIAGGHC